MVYDLPAGGKRLIQRAHGYGLTVCAGEVTYEDGEHTGALPGRLVRGAPEKGADVADSVGPGFYTPEHRALQDRFGTRRLADRWLATDVVTDTLAEGSAR